MLDAGNQIGSKFWEVISDEHGIDPAFLASKITEERADENKLQGMQDVQCGWAFQSARILKNVSTTVVLRIFVIFRPSEPPAAYEHPCTR